MRNHLRHNPVQRDKHAGSADRFDGLLRPGIHRLDHLRDQLAEHADIVDNERNDGRHRPRPSVGIKIRASTISGTDLTKLNTDRIT